MFFSKSNSILGIDIGTANVKIAEISHGKSPVLETYGTVNMAYKLSDKNNEEQIAQISDVLKTLIKKCGVKTNKCIISFPNSSVFTSVIELPQMPEKELGAAVEFEAKKYVPLALSDLDLAWTIATQNPNDKMFKILLTAVPKQITKNYLEVLERTGLVAEAGEIEALALIRSLVGNAPTNCVIIDIGARATGLNILENGLLKLSRNLNIGGETITTKVSESLNISFFRAEQFKKEFGLNSKTFVPETVKPVLNLIKNEVKQLLAIYQNKTLKIDKIILVGGGANLPGIIDFFSDLGITVELGEPLKSVGYDKSLEGVLKRFSLSLSIAIGLALRKEG